MPFGILTPGRVIHVVVKRHSGRASTTVLSVSLRRGHLTKTFPGASLGEESRWSGRLDLNQRPPEPHSGALPDCATPRPALMLAGVPQVSKLTAPVSLRVSGAREPGDATGVQFHPSRCSSQRGLSPFADCLYLMLSLLADEDGFLPDNESLWCALVDVLPYPSAAGSLPDVPPLTPAVAELLCGGHLEFVGRRFHLHNHDVYQAPVP